MSDRNNARTIEGIREKIREIATMAQLIEALRSTAAKWRAGNQEYREGVVLVWEGEVYGWKNELRDPASERPGAYAVDKAGLVFKAEGGDDYNGAKAWVAVDPDAQSDT